MEKKSKKEEPKYQQQIEQQNFMMGLAAQGDNSERAMLLRKLQQAKWNNKLGHR